MVEVAPARDQKIGFPKPGTLGVSRREFLHLAGLAAANAALGAFDGLIRTPVPPGLEGAPEPADQLAVASG